MKRALGCAADLWLPGLQGSACQSNTPSPAGSPQFSHQADPSRRRATLVKSPSRALETPLAEATGRLDSPTIRSLPAAGLSAQSRPSFPTRSRHSPSATSSTAQPGTLGVSVAKRVLPHPLGKAAAT